MSRVLNVILSHQRRADLERVLAWWAACAGGEDLLVAYGGTPDEYENLPNIARVFVDDASLRIANQPRGKQSHNAVWRAVAQWLEKNSDRGYTHLYYAEFDHLPLVRDLANRLVARCEEERADVLAHGLYRVDGTSNVHYLYHLADPAFLAFWRRISVRSEKEAVFKFLVTGSFWTREAFVAVASQEESVPGYVEIYIPTLAHHLGFRIRSLREQDRCVSTTPLIDVSVERARELGCWTMHPLKTVPPLEKAA